MKKTLWLCLGLVFPYFLLAQVAQPGPSIICHLNDFELTSRVKPPTDFRESGAARAEFIITFRNVPDAAQQAITFAAEIWGDYLSSEVPIRVEVTWDSLGRTALAAAGPSTIYRAFPGAMDPFVWYPVALAEAIAGEELNTSRDADIVVTVNEEVNWYLGTDGNPSRTQFDLVSVILHELGHGLGFLSSAQQTDNGEGELGFDDFMITYDIFLINGDGNFLRNELDFRNPSRELFQQFIGDDLFFRSDAASSVNGNEDPQLYAPFDFDEGSSISHLDEFVFPGGHPSSLMSPQLARGEVIHDPGPIGIAIMEEIGWNRVTTSLFNPQIDSAPLQVFPNPASERIRFSLPEFERNSEKIIRLHDLAGHLLLEKTETGFTNSMIDLDLSSFSPGIYLLSITDGQQLFREKVVKQ